MKEYTEYMDNINVDDEIHDDIMNRLHEKIFNDNNTNNKIPGKVHRRPPLRRLVAAAIIVTLTLSLATVAYAVGRLFVNRTDTGGRVELVVVPDESQVGFEYVNQVEVPQNVYSYRFDSDNYIYLNTGASLPIDDETAIKINDALKGKLFYEDGSPMDGFLIPATTGTGYWFDIPENHYMPLYSVWDENGHNISYVWWIIDKQELEILTFIPPEENILVSRYEEAVSLFGHEFVIPNIPGFAEDTYSWDPNPSIDGRNAVYVIFRNDSGQAIMYFAETVTESMILSEWYVTGTIEIIEINGTTVYMQRDDHQLDDGTYWGRNMWIHNDILYCLFYSCSYNLSDDEYVEVIASMIQ